MPSVPRPIRLLIVCCGVLALAAFLRLYDVSWDSGFHLHPDERFLTLVGRSLRLPGSPFSYLDPTSSRLNPSRHGYHFFVYGILPLTLNRMLADLLGTGGYDAFTLQGRYLSAIADLVATGLVMGITYLLRQRLRISSWIVPLAGLFYALAVLPIQLSHFFTVDSFLAAFMLASVYCGLRRALGGGGVWVAGSSIALAAAVACKPSGLFVLPLALFLCLLPDFQTFRKAAPGAEQRSARLRLMLGAAVYGIGAYLLVRLFDPYYFASANALDPRLSHDLLSSYDLLRAESNSSTFYPPAIQWIAKPPVLFGLTNLVVFGLGIAFVLCSSVGVVTVGLRRRSPEIAAILLWMLCFFLYQSLQFVQSMRYFLPLYPFLALLAALGFETLLRSRFRLVMPAVAVAVLIWPAAFFSIYLHQHSRVTASQWMYAHLPDGSVLADEEWDDGLPLAVSTLGKSFHIETLPVFQPDDAAKWSDMNTKLAAADYVVLSSNRGWGSIPTVPGKYPRTSRYYHDLLAGRLNFVRVQSFTSYPSLRYLGIPLDFPDQWSEEAFTVYDHPEVMIFRRK